MNLNLICIKPALTNVALYKLILSLLSTSSYYQRSLQVLLPLLSTSSYYQRSFSVFIISSLYKPLLLDLYQRLLPALYSHLPVFTNHRLLSSLSTSAHYRHYLRSLTTLSLSNQYNQSSQGNLA